MIWQVQCILGKRSDCWMFAVLNEGIGFIVELGRRSLHIQMLLYTEGYGPWEFMMYSQKPKTESWRIMTLGRLEEGEKQLHDLHDGLWVKPNGTLLPLSHSRLTDGSSPSHVVNSYSRYRPTHPQFRAPFAPRTGGSNWSNLPFEYRVEGFAPGQG